MIDKVRELLKQIDNLVTYEHSRLEDEIDSLKKQLSEINELDLEYDNLKKEAKKIADENKELKNDNKKLVNEVKQLKDFKNKYEKLEDEFKKKTMLLSGLKFTLKVITTWIPSQKENISVLLALASSDNYSSNYDKLSEKTKIPVVTLKNRVVPLLKEKNLVIETQNVITLNLDALDDDTEEIF